MLSSAYRRLRARVQKGRIGKFGSSSQWYGGEIHAHSKLAIGDYVYIGPNFTAHAFGGIEIENGTIIGPNLTIHTRNHCFENSELVPYNKEYTLKGVKIGKAVWIGDSVMILPGACIGDGVVVGAGSIVSGSVPAYSVIAGNPAKVIRYRDNWELTKKMIEEEKYYIKNKVKNAFLD